jgi:hypothetical protein
MDIVPNGDNHPGPNPMPLIYNATDNLARFENKNIFFYF